jgi:DNA invertase Pin-like site-specific DNA recombinase
MFGMLGVFAEFERAIVVERVKAGLARAGAQGTRLGRPKVAGEVEARIRELRAGGVGIKATAKRLSVGVGTVQRVDRELRAKDAVSGTWRS